MKQLMDKLLLLKLQKDSFSKKADEAYKNKEFRLENELQKEINSRNIEIEKIESRLVDLEFPNLDIEKEIEARRVTHDWSTSERCSKCAMKKSTTFEWKVEGVRGNFKEGFKSEAVKILNSMLCKGRSNES